MPHSRAKRYMSRLQKAPADGDSIMVYQPWRFSVRQELAIFIVEIGLTHHGVTAKKDRN